MASLTPGVYVSVPIGREDPSWNLLRPNQLKAFNRAKFAFERRGMYTMGSSPEPEWYYVRPDPTEDVGYMMLFNLDGTAYIQLFDGGYHQIHVVSPPPPEPIMGLPKDLVEVKV